MEIREGLRIDDERLEALCRKYHVKELALFGSVLRDDFTDLSDVDVLYVADLRQSGVPWAVIAIARELSEVFGRHVDAVERGQVHWFIRDKVEREAKAIYVAA